MIQLPRIPKAAAMAASLILATTIAAAGLQWQRDRLAEKRASATAASAPAPQQTSFTLVSDGLAAKVATMELFKAGTSITAQLHQINRPELVDALVYAAKNKVQVHVLLSRSSANYAKKSVEALLAAGARVTIDRGTEMQSGSLIVIDGQRAIAGSMWFGKNPARSLEHMFTTEQPQTVKAVLAAIDERIAVGENP